MIGFTGTKNDLSDAQLLKLEAILSVLYEKGSIFRHGDCVGADAAAAYFARKIGYYVIAHPPDLPIFRAFTKPHESMPEKTYLERNRDIVDNSHYIISVPNKPVTLEQILKCENGTRRGGTFYTTRYALLNKKSVYMILPSGDIESNE
jgi:hypothetical protein